MRIVCILAVVMLAATLVYAGAGDLIVSGKLGIGTTSPGRILALSSASEQPAIEFVDQRGNAGNKAAGFVYDGGIALTRPGIIYQDFTDTGGFTANRFTLFKDGSINFGGIIAPETAGQVAFTGGNVGIGTTAPPSTLSVVGSPTYAATGNVAALYVKGTADSPMNLTLDAAGTADNTARIRFLNNGATKWQIDAGDTFALQRYSTGAGNWHVGFAVGRETGNFHIGTMATTTGGVRSLVLRNGSKPTAIDNSAGLYAGDVGGITELFSFDESGNVTQQTAHAQDAPEALYDTEDGLPMIVKEVQHFLGYVRYTNHTRLARMAGMTDAEKASLSPAQRTCVIKENFAEHEARTGERLALLVWEDEQAAIKARSDAERQKMIDQANQLTATIAAKTGTAAASRGQSTAAVENELVQLRAQQAALTIPEEYVAKPVPERIRAALGR